jgi:glutamate--cysteine ligase
MSNPIDTDATPIASIGQLAAYLAEGGKPKDQWRIGTEHEKFGFRHAGYAAPGYEPAANGQGGIRAMLDGLTGPDWIPILDEGVPIGLKGAGARRGGSISLEPGGQFELSGAPLETLHQTKAELDEHCLTVSALAGGMGIGFAPLGFHPLARREDMPWMPKSRYAIMRRYMPLVGSMGLDMMLRTCTVQVNLDYESESDMRRKLRVALALQPLATALFANSPFTEGRPNGLLSARANVWTDVDADRTGMPALMFAEDFGFERFVDWLLDVPMYFILREGRYVDMAGCSFRDFMAGRLADRAGRGPATIGDFADHVTTVFTDVRLKQFLEMRGADAGTPAMMVAQSAFWVGLLYDDAALTAADAVVRQRPWGDYAALREIVPRMAMNAPWQSGTLRDLGREIVAIAQDGLRARAFRNGGHDESLYLDPLHEIVSGGLTQAENWLEKFHGPWDGNARLLLDEAQI